MERGGGVSTITVLPPFARDRAYTYPFLSGATTPFEQDCIWSAFNFFNDPPDDRFNDVGYVREVLKRDYYEIYELTQLGDLVLLTRPDETVVHAGSISPTTSCLPRNGQHPTQPWIFMRLKDMVDAYAARYPRSGPLKTRFQRLKRL